LTLPVVEASIDASLGSGNPEPTEPRKGEFTMPTDSPTPVKLTDVLVTATRTAGFELDLDELPVVTALRTDLVLNLVHAAVRHATNRWTRVLLGGAECDLREVVVDEHGDPVHPEELAYVTATIATVDRAEPLLAFAVAHACRRLEATGLVLPADDEPDPTPPDPSPPSEQPTT
jgi:hypothetical protein